MPAARRGLQRVFDAEDDRRAVRVSVSAAVQSVHADPRRAEQPAASAPANRAHWDRSLIVDVVVR